MIAGAGFAALGATLVFPRVFADATGSAAVLATELAYPIGDLLLASLVVAVLALRGTSTAAGRCSAPGSCC